MEPKRKEENIDQQPTMIIVVGKIFIARRRTIIPNWWNEEKRSQSNMSNMLDSFERSIDSFKSNYIHLFIRYRARYCGKKDSSNWIESGKCQWENESIWNFVGASKQIESNPIHFQSNFLFCFIYLYYLIMSFTAKEKKKQN